MIFGENLIQTILVDLTGNIDDKKLNLESFLGKSNLNKKVAYELIEKLGGIKKTELLAATYFKKATQKANLIKDEYIKQEMLKLIILALNREK